ncbi:MAG: hypothetical protein LIP15_06945, partial [Clostridium sp.]|nr:hypothetical protein [Clostridium sp.]
SVRHQKFLRSFWCLIFLLKKEKEKEKMNMETRKTSFEEKLKENLGAEYKVTFPQRMEKQDEEFLRVGVQKSGESAGIWIYLSGSEFHWLDNEEDIQRAVTKVIEEYKKKEWILKWSISHRR